MGWDWDRVKWNGMDGTEKIVETLKKLLRQTFETTSRRPTFLKQSIVCPLINISFVRSDIRCISSFGFNKSLLYFNNFQQRFYIQIIQESL